MCYFLLLWIAVVYVALLIWVRFFPNSDPMLIYRLPMVYHCKTNQFWLTIAVPFLANHCKTTWHIEGPVLANHCSINFGKPLQYQLGQTIAVSVLANLFSTSPGKPLQYQSWHSITGPLMARHEVGRLIYDAGTVLGLLWFRRGPVMAKRLRATWGTAWSGPVKLWREARAGPPQAQKGIVYRVVCLRCTDGPKFH